MLQALNLAASRMQQTASTQAMFQAISDELKKIDLDSYVFELNDEATHLVLRHMSYGSAIIKPLEKLSGIQLANVTFAVDQVEAFRAPIRDRQPICFKVDEATFRSFLPQAAQRFTKQILTSIRIATTINVPLIVGGKLIGLFSVQSDALVPDDIPAITAFGNQLAAAWNQLLLYQAAQNEIVERIRVENLVKALNKVASKMRQAKTTPEMFQAVSDELGKINKDCAIFQLDEAGDHLVTRHISYQPKLLTAAEKLAGVRAEDLELQFDKTEAFRRPMRDREAIFIEDLTDTIRESLPPSVSRFADQIVSILNVPRTINLPLIVGEELFGLFSVQSGDLLAADIPSIRAFANQLASAWQRLLLYEEAQNEIAERIRVENLLQGLNRGAASMQETNDLNEMFQAAAAELKEIDIFSAIFMLNEAGTHVTPQFDSFSGQSIRLLERLTGQSGPSFSVPIEATAALRVPVQERQAIFVEDSTETMNDILPRAARRFAKTIVSRLKIARSIYLPLIVGDKLIGVYSVQADDLRAQDIPTITAFANQLSARWNQIVLGEKAQTELGRREETEVELKRNLQIVNESSSFNELIISNSALGILVYHAESGNCVQANQAVARMVGASIEQMLEQNFRSIASWEATGLLEQAEATIQTGEQQFASMNFTTTFGRAVFLQVSLDTLFVDNEKHLLATIADVTESEQAWEAVRANEKLLREAQKVGQIGSYAFDESTSNWSSSEMLDNIFGLEGKFTRDLNGWLSLVHPEDREVMTSYFTQYVIAEKNHFDQEYRIVRPNDQQERWVHGLGELIFDEQGNILRMVGTIRDITARVKTDRIIQTQLLRLSALRKIDMAISGSLELDRVLAVIAQQSAEQLQADAVSLLLLSEDGLNLEHAASLGFQKSPISKQILPISQGIAGRAARHGETISVEDMRNQESCPVRKKTFKREGFKTHYATPLLSKDKVLGVLEVFHRSPFAAEPEWINFYETLAGQTSIAIENASLFEALQLSNTEVLQAYDATIQGWSRALELRDSGTKGHSDRTTDITISLAKIIGIVDEEELKYIRRGALLHDIGKMGIPDGILLKPGPLSYEEMEIMKMHTVYAKQMIDPIDFLGPSIDIPYCHHEKWDGSGYPRGLKGEEIPISARIFALVDVWDALKSDRPYRDAWPNKKVIEYIREQRGTHFDPQLTDIFLEQVTEIT